MGQRFIFNLSTFASIVFLTQSAIAQIERASDLQLSQTSGYVSSELDNNLDPELKQMSDDFVRLAPSDWSLRQGQWKYFDVENCFVNGPSCFGNNPTSPYGFPVFDELSGVGAFKMNASEAIVIFLRTPPEMRYFGFTQYLFQRAGQSRPAFGSLSDTLNNLRIKVIGHPAGVFDEYAVLVWTADLNTFELVKNRLALQGIPADQINLIEMPLQLPLFMGYSDAADTFAMLFRMALPTMQANLDAYIAENPFVVFKTGPTWIDAVIPGRANPYAEEETGVFEGGSKFAFNSLKQNLTELKQRILARFSTTHNILEQPVGFTGKTGWECIQGTAICNGDNHDALYSIDSSISFSLTKPNDFVLIVGVNNQKTGKVRYLNHTVYDPETLAGIVSVSDPNFTTASALYFAGITRPTRQELSKYSNMYAYAISYNCGSMKFCLQIPAPTADNPVGLEPGSPIFLLGRKYVDTRSGVRPSDSEVVKHSVFVLNEL